MKNQSEYPKYNQERRYLLIFAGSLAVCLLILTVVLVVLLLQPSASGQTTLQAVPLATLQAANPTLPPTQPATTVKLVNFPSPVVTVATTAPATTVNSVLTSIPTTAVVTSATTATTTTPFASMSSPTVYPVTTARPVITATVLPSLLPTTPASLVITSPVVATASSPAALKSGLAISNLPDGRLKATLSDLHLTVEYEASSWAATNLNEFVSSWQEAYTYVSQRLHFQTPINMTFVLRTDGSGEPLGLGVRGFSDVPKATIYQLYDGTGDKIDREYITAHELGHMVIFKKVGWGVNLMLIEGYAMYASEEFLRRDGLVTLHDFAVAAYQQDRLVSLGSLSLPNANFNGRLIDRVDYDQAGSFVSWLIETYGMEKFEKVYTTAGYTNVYSKTLKDLTQEWTNFLAQRSKTKPLAFDSALYFKYLNKISQAYVNLYAKAAKNANQLDAATYKAIDAARLEIDRHHYAAADALLQNAGLS